MVRVAKIMVVLGLLVLCGPAWAVEPNLVSHWKFDDGSGTTAYDSAGDNNGTIYGAVWTTGQIDGALSFDGVDDYVDVGDPPDGSLDFGTSTDFSISLWFNTSRSTGSYFVCKRAKGYYAGYDFYIERDGKIFARIADGWSIPDARTTEGFNDGLWHHAAAVYDRDGQITIYVDNVSKATSVSIAGVGNIDNSQPFTIGDRNDPGWHAYFDGPIDDVRIYGRALSAEEIEELYYGQLLSLEIVGPAEVAENSQVSYKAIAHYDIGSPKDVTNSADWSVEPNAIASIDSNGLLATEEIYILEEDITIYAQYTEDTNTFEAEKAVSVLAICPTGTALGFDGVNDYVDVGSAPSLEPSSFTISAWIKPEDVSSRQQIAGKLGNEPVHNRGYGYSLEVLDGKASLLIDPAGCCNGNPIKSETSLEVGKWYFVAGTYDGSTGTIYVDGQPENSDSWTLGAYYTNFYIGARRSDYHSAFYDHFSGVIDEVRVYDRALSPEEIQANMHILLSGDEPNLVGYWGFGEGKGQVAYDLSGNSNNGYLGSDPCDVDSADPAWVESDAPIGICTTGGLIERNITRALESKQRALEEIEAALANENATIGVLEALFRSRDYGNLDKNDIVKAKQEIHSAVQNEQRSTDTLEKSIEKLEDSLSVLGYEVEPNGSNN